MYQKKLWLSRIVYNIALSEMAIENMQCYRLAKYPNRASSVVPIQPFFSRDISPSSRGIKKSSYQFLSKECESSTGKKVPFVDSENQ